MRIVERLSVTSFWAYCDRCGMLRLCEQYRVERDLYRGACCEPLLQPCLCRVCAAAGGSVVERESDCLKPGGCYYLDGDGRCHSPAPCDYMKPIERVEVPV